MSTKREGHPVKALIASRGPHYEAVEFGGRVRFDAEEYGETAADLGFPAPPGDGLWICVGRWVWRPSVDHESGIDEGEFELVDPVYRPLTRSNRERIAAGLPLWRSRWDAPWRAPREKRAGRPVFDTFWATSLVGSPR